MKALGFNPYLPSWEFVPDGEPHVFDGRVYLYGSHDSRNGVSFCEGDYVVWSAPVNDPGNWRYEGVSYRKEQDPLNGAPYEGELPQIDMPLGTPENPHLLYAPDVAKGPGALTKVTGVHSVYVKVTEGILDFASIKIE